MSEKLDALYRLLPGEFTAARNALVKELKAAGEKELAAKVQKLGKPTVAAWAVNQLALQEAQALREFFAASDALKAVQFGSKQVSRETLDEAMGEHRKALGNLIELAREHLEKSGQGGNEGTLEKIRATLRAVGAGDGREQVEEGRLTHEITEAPSLFGVASLSSPVKVPEPKASPPKKPSKAANDDEEKEAAEKAKARELAKVAREAAEAARKDADAAEELAKEKARASEAADAEVEKAKAALEAAREKAQAAHAAARDAKADAHRAAHEADKLERAAAKAAVE